MFAPRVVEATDVLTVSLTCKSYTLLTVSVETPRKVALDLVLELARCFHWVHCFNSRGVPFYRRESEKDDVRRNGVAINSCPRHLSLTR